MPFLHGVGPLEWVIILVIVIIVFGVGKLPSVGGALGRGIREFREQARPEKLEKDGESEDKSATSAMKSETKADVESAAKPEAAEKEAS